MSVTHNGKKPGTLWHLRTRTGAFIAACKDKSTRHIARVMRRDAGLSTSLPEAVKNTFFGDGPGATFASRSARSICGR